MKKLCLTFTLLSCIVATKTAGVLEGRGATEVRSVMLPPCKIEQLNSDDTTLKQDFDRKTLTLTRTLMLPVDRAGHIYTHTFKIQLFPDRCRHESLKDGFINRYTNTPHCEECKKAYDEWLKDAQGSIFLIAALTSAIEESSK